MEPSKTPLELAALATAAVPGLQVTEIRGPQIQGPERASTRICDAQGNSWTVTSTAEKLDVPTLTKRQELLQFLASCSSSDLLPFSVPQMAAWTPSGNGTYAVLYSVTPGTPIDLDSVTEAGLLSGSLARALAALHSLEPLALQALGAKTQPVAQIRESLRAGISSVGRELPGPLRKRWLCAIDEDVVWGFEPAPTHGDLSLEAILASHGAVRSFTGCETLELADPATDLAWLLPLVSDEFLESLVDAYSAARTQTDLHIFTRAQLYSELALLDWLRYGITRNDRDVMVQAEAMLAELNTDLAGAMLVEPTRPVVQVHFEAADEPLHRVRRAELEDQETQPHTPDFEIDHSEAPSVFPSEDIRDVRNAETEAFDTADTTVQSLLRDGGEIDAEETGSFEFPRAELD